MAETKKALGVSEVKRQSSRPDSFITMSELNTVFETNQRAIELYVEIGKQQEDILEKLEYIDKIASLETKVISLETKIDSMRQVALDVPEIKKKVDEVERSLFKLNLFLGSTGVALIIAIVQQWLSSKK